MLLEVVALTRDVGVTSIPLVSRTRATLRSAEFGFFGVVRLHARADAPLLRGAAEGGVFVFVYKHATAQFQEILKQTKRAATKYAAQASFTLLPYIILWNSAIILTHNFSARSRSGSGGRGERT